MTIPVRFLPVFLLIAGCGPATAAPGRPRPATVAAPLPFFVEARWFRGDYELSLPALNFEFSAEFEYAVKPWQLTVGRNVTPRLAVQLGYSYAHLNYRQSRAAVNSAGQTIGTTYHDEVILNCLPLLVRYDLASPSQAVHVDLLLGLTGITTQDVLSIATTINGQPATSRRLASRATQLYATGGAGCHYPFGRHFEALLDLTLNRDFRSMPEAGGNVLGLTWAGGLGLRYRFAVKKQPAAVP